MTKNYSSWLGLEGKICAVTGAASGIGAIIARELLHAGARVALLDRDEEKARRLVESLVADCHDAQAVAVGCDTSSTEEVAVAADRVLETLGLCDVLVNNAGILTPSSLDAVSLDDWNRVLAVNLTGYLLCSRSFAVHMARKGGGVVIHVASISASFPQTHSGAYSAGKAGVLLMSRQMAVEWGAKGIRSNAVSPGMIRTPLSEKFYEDEDFLQKRAAMTASRRIGEPLDIANAVVYLASPRASYINGAELMVDGGMSSILMDMVPRPGFNQTT